MSIAIQKNASFHQHGFDYRPFFRLERNPYYLSDLGVLFSDDCMHIFSGMQDNMIDTVFADPPFNLNKEYGKQSKDNLTEEEYLVWSYHWIDECIRVLKPGGSLFLYNLPKWNIMLGAHLTQRGMMFRHWIAIAMSYTLPIPKRLYPAHYSLLYYTKGKPKTFRKIRTPIKICRHCGGEIHDYGGHRDAINPNGINLKDVWTDIPPVRHWKFKSKARKTNALSTKILERIVEMSTYPGDIVLDPFGGSGTTFAVCEEKHRHWIGIDLESASVIVERLKGASIHHHKNNDFIED